MDNFYKKKTIRIISVLLLAFLVTNTYIVGLTGFSLHADADNAVYSHAKTDASFTLAQASAVMYGLIFLSANMNTSSFSLENLNFNDYRLYKNSIHSGMDCTGSSNVSDNGISHIFNKAYNYLKTKTLFEKMILNTAKKDGMK